jgi:hypothetical protein
MSSETAPRKNHAAFFIQHPLSNEKAHLSLTRSIDETLMVLFFSSSVPVTFTFCAANFAGAF